MIQVAERPHATELTKRIGSLDFLRGISILGILFINIEGFCYPDPWSPFGFGFFTEQDHSTRYWVYFLTQGKFYSMLSFLFGVGFYLFIESKRKLQGPVLLDLYGKRLLGLFLIGIIHAYFIWDGDILIHYSILGLFVIPFRQFSNKTLLIIVGILSFVLWFNAYQNTKKRIKRGTDYKEALSIPDDERTPDQRKSIRWWEARSKAKESDTSHYENPRPNFLKGVEWNFDHLRVHLGHFYFTGIAIRTIILMLVGIIFFRMGVFTDPFSLKFYWPLTLFILGLGLLVNHLRHFHWAYEYYHLIQDQRITLAHTFPKEILGVGYVLLFNGIYQLLRLNKVRDWISLIGQTALSNYLFQSIILGSLFYGYGFDLYNELSRTQLLMIVPIIWAIQFLFTLLWLRKYKRGPIETIWRKFTYKN